MTLFGALAEMTDSVVFLGKIVSKCTACGTVIAIAIIKVALENLKDYQALVVAYTARLIVSPQVETYCMTKLINAQNTSN